MQRVAAGVVEAVVVDRDVPGATALNRDRTVAHVILALANVTVDVAELVVTDANVMTVLGLDGVVAGGTEMPSADVGDQRVFDGDVRGIPDLDESGVVVVPNRLVGAAVGDGDVANRDVVGVVEADATSTWVGDGDVLEHDSVLAVEVLETNLWACASTAL